MASADSRLASEVRSRWGETQRRFRLFQKGLLNKRGGGGGTLFAHVRGVLTNAVVNGDWVLLDEINMAQPETLLALNSVLGSNSTRLVLGDDSDAVVERHPDFRLFACMNPATDVGKRSLSENLRNRFIEYFVAEPEDEKDIFMIVRGYLDAHRACDKQCWRIVKFYLAAKRLAQTQLSDGTGGRPSFSLRTLCRLAMTFVQIC